MNEHMTTRTATTTRLLLCVAFLLAACASSHSAKPSNKWRIECSEGAKSTGEIVFRVTPVGGEPMEVVAHIKKGTRENRVATMIKKAFKAQLPKGDFHIEKDDNEDVLVKRRWGSPIFDLELVSSTVKAVRINLDRE